LQLELGIYQENELMANCFEEICEPSAISKRWWWTETSKKCFPTKNKVQKILM